MIEEIEKSESPDGIKGEGKITALFDGVPKVQKDKVANAVREMRPRAPINRAAGFFKHPQTFTEEEINYVVDCLKMNIPVYTIANMIHCERHTLSKLIHSMPELQELLDAKYENMLDEAEFQLDRLNRAGTPSTIIFTLQSKGWKRGWGGPGVGSEEDENGEGGDRIVMGLISPEEVKAAQEKIEASQKQDEKVDPLKMAMEEEAVQAEVEKRVEEAKPQAIDIENVQVSAPPYGGGDTYGGMGGYGDDPWASGGDSMFAQ